MASNNEYLDNNRVLLVNARPVWVRRQDLLTPLAALTYSFKLLSSTFVCACMLSDAPCLMLTRSIKKFKLYLTMQHGRSAADKLFWEIRALIVRTLQAVKRLIIHDKQSFEV